jgi:ribosomal protein S27E
MAKCPHCGKEEKFVEERKAFSEAVSIISCAGCGTAIFAYPLDELKVLGEISDNLEKLLDHFDI